MPGQPFAAAAMAGDAAKRRFACHFQTSLGKTDDLGKALLSGRRKPPDLVYARTTLQSLSRSRGDPRPRRITSFRRLRDTLPEGRRQAPDILVTRLTLHPETKAPRSSPTRLDFNDRKEAQRPEAKTALSKSLANLEVDNSNESLHRVLLAGCQIDGKVGHVTRLNADHPYPLVIAEIRQGMGLLRPGIPDNRVA